MDISPLDVVLRNWEPLVATLGVGLLGVMVTAWRMSERPAAKTALFALFWALTTFILGAGLTLWNGVATQQDVLYAHDPSSSFVLDVWRAQQIVNASLLLSAIIAGLVLLSISIIASRRPM